MRSKTGFGCNSLKYLTLVRMHDMMLRGDELGGRSVHCVHLVHLVHLVHKTGIAMQRWFSGLLICLIGLLLGGASGAASTPALSALIGPDGIVQISGERGELATINAGLFDAGWKGAEASGHLKATDLNSSVRKFTIRAASGGIVAGEAAFTATAAVTAAAADGSLRIVCTLVPADGLSLNSLHVEIRMAESAMAGGTWSAGGKNGSFPAVATGTVGLFNGLIQAFTLAFPGGETVDVSLREPAAAAAPVRVLLQDNRRWGPTFSARIGPQGDAALFTKGVPVTIALELRAKGGIRVEFDKPVTIEAGPDWIPLKLELDVVPGSALDFSTQGFCDAPAGKHGRLMARPDGQFAFEKTPDIPRRFYGVNFCFSSLYVPHEQADTIADRLVRLGYNAVRVHHYEGELVQGQPSTLTFNPAKLDQLDYLLAAFIKRGIYVTTDLFVSRPVTPQELGLAGPAARGTQYEFKVLVPVMEKAWESWAAFAKAFLGHVNPYTGRSYAQEPGLAWLSMINEGNLGNYWGAIREIPEWTAAWNKWLAGRYADRAALAAAYGADLQDAEDPARGTVKLPSEAYADTVRSRDGVAFLSATEAATFTRMRDFLRNDLGCKALLTSMNGWSNRATDQAARNLFDYADDHFYIDHPQFLEKPWQLPSRCRNSSPVAAGAADGRHNGFVRLIGKPFTISEYNYSAPGRYRGVGGILTGAMAAIQGWGGVWRFAYSHNRDNLFQPSKARSPSMPPAT